MIYAGIGNRYDVPQRYLNVMTEIAYQAAIAGYTLRSGGAVGSDSAFEKGCDNAKGSKEIFLPWRGFNHNNSQFFNIPEEAYAIAAEHHPKWYKLKPGAQKLLARNAQIILGDNLNAPVNIVICYVEDECTSHGTRHALRIARDFGINTFNLTDYSYHSLVQSLFK